MIGKTISHYKILEKLGEGGMGVVYKAEDTQLKRFVALKFLPTNLTQEEDANERFIREAQAASALDHPNICTIYSIEQTDKAETFICMAHYDGETLKDKIKRKPLTIEQAIDIAKQIANGVARAHEAGIIHRDIKPGNIIVTNRGEVKILDFGLAKLAGQTITKSGSTLGTVAYMSPEQVQGGTVDERTDIWALGVVLYEMLTGDLPFKGEYEPAIQYAILHLEPEPITGLCTGIPLELERIVTKCLEKNPSERYQHADELMVDLRRLKKETGSKETLTKAGVRTKVTKKRVRTFLLPGIILVAAILMVIGYFSFFGKQAESAERIPIAVVDFVNETDEQELNGLSGMLITALEQSRRLSVLTRSSMFDILKQMGKEDAEHIDEILGREICKQANVEVMAIASIKKFARVYTIDLKLLGPEENQYLFTAKEKGEGQESVPDMIDRLAEKTRKALKEKTEEIQATSQKVADVITINLEAYQHYFKGEEFINKMRYTKAKQEFEKAIALDSTFGLAYYRLAHTSRGLSENEQAKTMIQKAVVLIDRISEKERYRVRAEYARIEQRVEAGIAILKEMERIYPYDKEMIYHIGSWSYDIGQYNAALKYMEKVLTLDPTFERALRRLMLTYDRMGQFEKMLEVFKKRLELAKGRLAVGSPESFFKLYAVCFERGLHHQALKYLRKAIELDPLIPSYYHQSGMLNRRRGNTDQSIIDYQNALELAPDSRGIVNGLAKCLMIAKKYVEAEEHLIKAEKLSPGSPDTKKTRALLSAALGKKDEALELPKDIGLNTKYNKMAVYCLLGLKDEAIKLIENEPWADYLVMLHHPYFEILRDTDEFKTALQKAKEIYEEKLKKYQEVFL